MKQRTNMDRAQEGLKLCELMEQMTGVDDLQSQISDALTHLMHTARLIPNEAGEPIDFAICLDNAVINFEAEVNEDEDH